MQAIQTRFLGPTNTHGARVKAWCEAGALTSGWRYAYTVEENHRLAAEALRAKLGWYEETHGRLVGGALPKPNDGGYAFVFVREALTPAQRKAAQRRRARAQGLCVVCCTAEARPGRATCAECNASAQDRQGRNGVEARERALTELGHRVHDAALDREARSSGLDPSIGTDGVRWPNHLGEGEGRHYPPPRRAR